MAHMHGEEETGSSESRFQSRDTEYFDCRENQATVDRLGVACLDEFFVKPALSDVANKYFTHMTLPRFRKDSSGRWCKVERGDLEESKAYPGNCQPSF